MSIVEAEHPAGVPVSVTVEVGGKEITFETGKLAKQADGAVARPQRRHRRSRHGAGPDGGARRRGLLPAHGRRRGAHVRRREDPRRLLQARGPPHGARDPDRAHDRPPGPAALAEGLPQRDAVRRHGPLGRHGHRARHPLHQRRLGGADRVAAAVPRPDRRRADGPRRRRASSSTRRSRRSRSPIST